MRSTFLPPDAARLFEGLAAPWWIAGGWALDLHLGRATRPHEDLDVAILRRDLPAFRRRLEGWRLHVGHGEGVVEEAPLGEMPPERHAVWCRPAADAPWAFELLLNEADGDLWRFRRDPAVTRPLASLQAPGSRLPCLAPEVVLLYKAKALRAVDVRDFDAVAPTLAPPARAWLRGALARAHPGHPWLARLADAPLKSDD